MSNRENMKTSRCITSEELLQMVDSNFDNQQQKEMREHIKECKACRQLFKNISNLEVVIKTKRLNFFPKYKEKCLDEQQIAGFVDNSLTDKDKHRIGRHLLHCDNCLHQIVQLNNMVEDIKSSDLETVPDNVLLQVKQIVLEKTTGINRWKSLLSEFHCQVNDFFEQTRSLRWLGYGVAALLFIFIISFPVNKIFINSSRLENEITRTENKIIQSELKLLIPEPGTIIQNKSITFVCQKLANVEEYHFTLLNNVGDLIWETNVKKNMVKLPQGVKLTNNENFFWKVEALINDDFSISSPVCMFTFKKK